MKPLPNQGLRSVYSYIQSDGVEMGLSLLCDAARRVLAVDAPDQVGTFKVQEALNSICRDLPFGKDACSILLDADYARRRCTKEVALTDLTASLKGAEPRTAGKYHPHLRRLSEKPSRGVPVLVPAHLTLLLCCREELRVAARTIFNGHILKTASPASFLNAAMERVLKAVSEATARSANSTTHAKACIQVVTVCCDAR